MALVEREVIVRDSDLLDNRPFTTQSLGGRPLTYMEYLVRFEGVTDPAQIIWAEDGSAGAVGGRRFVLRQEQVWVPVGRDQEPPGMVRHVLRHWWDLLAGLGAVT